MKSIGEFLLLAALSRYRNFREERWIKKRYYCHFLFQRADTLLKQSYCKQSPYKISKQHFLSRGAQDVHVYGETPLSTWEYILGKCGIHAGDCLYDLGCGTGRGVFFVSAYFGCRAVGVDFISSFIHKAKEIQRQIPQTSLHFVHGDITTCDLSEASVIYLYGTCLDDSTIEALSRRFSSLKKGVKVITVSYPLSDYLLDNPFAVKEVFSAKYAWGEAEVFYQEKVR